MKNNHQNNKQSAIHPTSSLISEKLQPNLNPKGAVRREALMSLINSAIERKVTLILAPAGSGKSTLLAQWFNEYNIAKKIAWLELDQQDNNTMRFFGYLVAALKQCLPDLEACLFNKIIDEYEYSIIDQCEVILSALKELGKPIYIIIDDFQFVQEQELIDGVNYFIRHLPSNVRLILASREEPNILISQLRIQDDITLITHENLRFNTQEISQLHYNLHGKECNIRTSEKLFDRTEGWIAGIKLALLSGVIDNETTLPVENPATGFHDYLVNYFANGVINNLKEDLKEIVVKTALLDWFSDDVLNYVLEIENAADKIQYLVQRQLFVIPIDHYGRRFRYHGLFRSFLLSYIKINYPHDINRIHKRAVDYLLKHGYWNNAMKHADLSNSEALKHHTFKICCVEWLREGDFESVIYWSKQFDDAFILNDISIAACLICAYAFTRKFNQADYYFKELDRAREQQPKEARLQQEQDHYITLLHAILDMLQQNMKEYRFDDTTIVSTTKTARGLNAFRQVISAYHYLQSGATANARKEAEKAKEQLEILNQNYLKGYAELILILVDRLEGNNIQAMLRAEANYALVKNGPHNPIWLNSAAAIAVVKYEQNRLEEAKSLLVDIVPLLSSAGATEIITSCYCILARIHSIQGNFKEANRILNYLKSVLEIGHYDYFISSVYQEAMLTALSNGRSDIVSDLYDKISSQNLVLRGNLLNKEEYDLSWDRYTLCIAYYWYSKGDYSHALRIAKNLATLAKKNGLYSRYAVSQGFVAVCLDKLDQKNKAYQVLQGTIEIAGIETFNRSFFDEAPGVRHVFSEFITQKNNIKLPPLFVDMFSDLYAANQNNELQGTSFEMLDELTDRETELLRLLCEGYSNKEISAMSDIALSTTKWHFKNIYSKLNVRNRTEAVILADRLDLLAKL